MKILPLPTLAVAVLSFNAMAYDYTVNNASSYEIVVYNGASQVKEIIPAGDIRTIHLRDGDPYQIQYNGGSPFTTDYLGSISRDGYSGFVSVTYQQPANSEIVWWSRDLSIGRTNYKDAQFKAWPDVISIPGCNNRSWGSICSAQANKVSATFSNQ